MPAQLPAHKFRSTDAEKFERNAEQVWKFMRKAGMTPVDLLMGLRYHCERAYKFDEALEESGEWCRNYDVHYNIDPDLTEARYGKEN